MRWLVPVLVALGVVSAIVAILLATQSGTRNQTSPQAVVSTQAAVVQPATTAASTTAAVTVVQTTTTNTTSAAANTTAAAATTAANTSAAVVSTTVEAEPTIATVPPGSFQNPIFRQDFPDPFVLNVKDTFYAFATNGSGRNIQVATSTDLINWELQNDALPALPTWAKLGGSLVWAPEVIAIGSKYNMYYTARDKASNKQCVGVAVADNPQGFYKDSSDKALVCQADEGGTIDPSPYRDGDKLYLYFKNDGNCCAQTTYLYVQEMAPDGLSLVGKPTQLVKNDATWEGAVVEAPTMVKHEQSYFLFFSGNNYAGLDYAVGYATCKTAVGPCQDAPENPILKTALVKPPVIGPGHQHVLQIGNDTWMVYHVWEVSNGVKTSRRFMWLDRVNWKDGKPQVQGPTSGPQPAPRVKP